MTTQNIIPLWVKNIVASASIILAIGGWIVREETIDTKQDAAIQATDEKFNAIMKSQDEIKQGVKDQQTQISIFKDGTNDQLTNIKLEVQHLRDDQTFKQSK